VPQAFPFVSPAERGAASALAAEGIEAWQMWQRPHPDTPSGYPGAARWRRELLLLPVHHGLSDGDVDRVADAAERIVPPAARAGRPGREPVATGGPA
jgi:dTDP-4-amino-4,6-dideoxygalactose transaminase